VTYSFLKHYKDVLAYGPALKNRSADTLHLRRSLLCIRALAF